MTMRASIHHPPSPSTRYVRVEVDGHTVGYLNANYYDTVHRTEGAFNEAMKVPDAEREPHTKDGRWVVRLRGQHALFALHAHLSLRSQ